VVSSVRGTSIQGGLGNYVKQVNNSREGERGERIDHQYDNGRRPPYHNTMSSVSTIFCVFVGRFREVTGVKWWKNTAENTHFLVVVRALITFLGAH
jgi:hypothetical protein